MTRKGRRLTLIGTALAIAGVAMGLMLYAVRDSIVFFYAPSEVAAKGLGPGTRLRLGGLVEQGSVHHLPGGTVRFTVTDMAKTVAVTYTGLLPDLFREGQGIVAEGVIDAPGAMTADAVLAKHDERYMPRDVADKLKRQGLWRDGAEAAATPAGPAATPVGQAAPPAGQAAMMGGAAAPVQ
ncbi:cytochrome c maturation protein CcmE [Lichenihabitans sp. Uapishka_5]|uniref:cytochrome c maturation protein CcmE n=1 Tax=Lichenihabitans sp. Uapishka_5 TaxID=3037302 RepID=UPI0029E82142|nr:cytochrome c maturation protein CcmE [Lichenihabitans sp. Uapishka_5]MDX7953695.1 cytochrome c maturation protein CcmE [Lichenihabitans sp. Uapishka_5]